jgi:hypothetical protein
MANTTIAAPGGRSSQSNAPSPVSATVFIVAPGTTLLGEFDDNVGAHKVFAIKVANDFVSILKCTQMMYI